MPIVESSRAGGKTAIPVLRTNDDERLASAATGDADRVFGPLDPIHPGPLEGGLHDFSPLLVLPLSALHAVALLLDATARISVRDLLVPFVASYGQLAIGLGTISLDLLVVVLVTTWLRPRMSNRVWQLFHRLSYAAFVALFFHSILSGTDLTSPVIAGLAWIAALVVAYYSLERVLGSLTRPESSRARA